MSDGINDVEKEKELDRLNKLNIKAHVLRLKQLRHCVIEYHKIICDLSKLGYIIKEKNDGIEVWKEIK